MSRLKQYERRAALLTSALNLAAETNYLKVTHYGVAERAEVSRTLVHKHFKTAENLRSEIMRAAIATRRLSVIAQGLVNKDPEVLNAPEFLKKLAVASLGEFHD